jgi:molybdopterin-guanine dinucleotide biosynthesis protein A
LISGGHSVEDAEATYRITITTPTSAAITTQLKPAGEENIIKMVFSATPHAQLATTLPAAADNQGYSVKTIFAYTPKIYVEFQNNEFE